MFGEYLDKAKDLFEVICKKKLELDENLAVNERWSEELSKLEDRLVKYEKDIKQREKVVLTSEEIIQKELVCDKKIEEARKLLDDHDAQVRSSDDVRLKESSLLDERKKLIEEREKEVEAKLEKFAQEQKNWKSKLMSQINKEIMGD
jgi:hypothetical protein